MQFYCEECDRWYSAEEFAYGHDCEYIPEEEEDING
jgi:hypothetical protein